MKKMVSGNDETQKTISLNPRVVPLDILFFCIGLSLSYHGQFEESLSHDQNIHLCLPFEVVEWSQDDMVRLIHFFSNSALILLNALPRRVIIDPTIEKREEKNQYKVDLIPFGN